MRARSQNSCSFTVCLPFEFVTHCKVFVSLLVASFLYKFTFLNTTRILKLVQSRTLSHFHTKQKHITRLRQQFIQKISFLISNVILKVTKNKRNRVIKSITLARSRVAHATGSYPNCPREILIPKYYDTGRRGDSILR